MYKYKLKDLLWEMFGSVFEALKHMPELSLKSYSITTVVTSDQQLDLHLQSCKKRNRHYPPDPPKIGLVAGGCVTRTGGGSSIYTVSTQYLKYLHSIYHVSTYLE